MAFQNYAATETSTLLERLLARQSAASLQQLQAMREALDVAARAFEAPLGAEAEILDLVGRLTESADADLRRAREEAHSAIEAANSEIRTHVAEIEQLRGAIVQSDAEAAILRSELQTAQERAAAADRDLEETLEAHAALEEALRKTEAESHQGAETRAAVEAQLSDARAAIDLMLIETEELRAQRERDAAERATLQELLTQAHQAGDQRDRIAAELEASSARIRGLEGELVHAREELDATAAQFDAATARVHA
ncbi:MAG: hypothetical protein ACRD15_14320, partial [Vicinamibacterales bacterium]